MPIIFTILVLFIIVGFIFHFRLLTYLKQNHHAAWELLGSPSFLNNSMLNNGRVMGFLFKKKYLGFNDVTLNKKTNLLLMLDYVYLGIFALAIVLLVITIIQNSQ